MTGLLPTRIETLGRENFDTWKIQIEALLIKNYLWEYVNGTKEKPADETSATDWVTNDRKARSDLILAINPSELKQIKDCKTARDVWVKLHDIYQSKGPARKTNLLKQLSFSRMKITDIVRIYVSH